MGSSFKGRIPGLHPGDEGSSPSGSTTFSRRCRSTEGPPPLKRKTRDRHPPAPPSLVADAAGPWTAHNRSEQGSTPWSATTHDSFNGRTAVLQAAYRGSIPRSCTNSFDGERGLEERRGAVAPGRCRFDSGRSPQSSSSGRRVIGSPPASGAGAWRFESSRPDHWQIVQRQDGGL